MLPTIWKRKEESGGFTFYNLNSMREITVQAPGEILKFSSGVFMNFLDGTVVEINADELNTVLGILYGTG
jgi:hypothetical protein